MQNSNKKRKKHTSHIALHTSQRGITLIALIITIIVMLILVGVTINVALNGGLFEKAETATRQTEEQAILEEMVSMMEIEDGKIKHDTIIAKMKEKYTVEYNYPNATITGKLGKYNYIVSETEIKIGSKGIKSFEWKDVELTVEAGIDYRFNDSNSGTKYIINFTENGELIVKADGTTIGTYNAKEYINEDGNLMIPFTYNYTGKTYDTTLIMNSDGINVDANLLGLGVVTYKKIVPDRIYGPSDGGIEYIVLSGENELIYIINGQKLIYGEFELFEGTIEEFEEKYSKQYQQKENVNKIEEFIVVDDFILGGLSENGNIYYPIQSTNDANGDNIPEITVGDPLQKTEFTLEDII